MAYANKIIRNPVIGQEIRFLQTGKDTAGKLLEMEATYLNASKEPAPHYHPYQHEEFRVLNGEITVRIEGGLKVLKAGDRLSIPPNTVHSMWNNHNEKAMVNWKVTPAMTTEYFLETATGLASDGKTNRKGMPPLLQVALLADRFSGVFRLEKPHFAIQKIVFILLTPIALLAGYRATYKKYLD